MSNTSITNAFLYGLDSTQLVESNGYLLEESTAIAFEQMTNDAYKHGIELTICSSFRSFEAQLSIWNNKATGKRKVLDKNSNPIDITALSNDELVQAILTWSALPGTSRHHWGTDVDVFDANQINKTELQLIPQEYESNGPCLYLSNWLDDNAHKYGFYRPYQTGKSGVSPEPWHISFAPKSLQYMALFQQIDLRKIISEQKIELYDSIEAQLNEIIAEYFYRVACADQIELNNWYD